MNYYFEVLKKYAVFKGRARRKEYWMFYLFNLIISLVLIYGWGVIGVNTKMNIPFVLYTIAMEIPCIAVSVRRLHDTNRSGWYILMNFFPIIGSIVFLVFMVEGSQPGENQYGPNPKDIEIS